MKHVFIIILLSFTILSCNQQAKKTEILQKRVDSLETKLANAYKPGFGEFMSGIQAHHAKLWFAGQNQNWKLADFEIHEIGEAVTNIQKYQKEREESEMITMISPALDSLSKAIERKDPELFKNSYTLLTNSCNNCHRLNDFGFNVVKIPDAQPFSNQEFSIKETK